MSFRIAWSTITESDVLQAHFMAIERFGGVHSHPKVGCVERCLAAAITGSLYGQDQDNDGPSLTMIAAFVLVYLAKNHCFVDGNKRVAWASLVRTFHLNGLHVRADQIEAANVVCDVVVGNWDVRDVVRWLSKPGRVVAISD